MNNFLIARNLRGLIALLDEIFTALIALHNNEKELKLGMIQVNFLLIQVEGVGCVLYVLGFISFYHQVCIYQRSYAPVARTQITHTLLNELILCKRTTQQNSSV